MQHQAVQLHGREGPLQQIQPPEGVATQGHDVAIQVGAREDAADVLQAGAAVHGVPLCLSHYAGAEKIGGPAPPGGDQ